MAPSARSPRADRSGFYLALTVVAALVTLYLVFLMIGFIFKLLFFTAAALIAVAAFRVWRAKS